jgi:hypothetical protein
MAALDLRPLSLGELLDRTFSVYRRHFLVFAGIATIPYVFVFIAVAAVAVAFGIAIPFSILRAGHAPFSPPMIGALFFGVLIIVLASLAAFAVSAGATVIAVSEIYGVRKPAIWASLRAPFGKAWRLIGVTVLISLIAFGGMIFLIIPGIYLGCRMSVAIAAALIDDAGPADAIRRSFFLTKGYAGRVFLIFLLTLALTYAAVAFSQIPFAILIAASAKNRALVLLWTALMEITSLLANVAIAPISSIALALYYYDLRIRKEAFDLQMMMQTIGPDPMPPAISGGVPSAFGRDAS